MLNPGAASRPTEGCRWRRSDDKCGFEMVDNDCVIIILTFLRNKFSVRSGKE